jgi:hypothetical protein
VGASSKELVPTLFAQVCNVFGVWVCGSGVVCGSMVLVGAVAFCFFWWVLFPGSLLSVCSLFWHCDRFPLVGAGYLRYTVLELC